MNLTSDIFFVFIRSNRIEVESEAEVITTTPGTQSSKSVKKWPKLPPFPSVSLSNSKVSHLSYFNESHCPRCLTRFPSYYSLECCSMEFNIKASIWIWNLIRQSLAMHIPNVVLKLIFLNVLNTCYFLSSYSKYSHATNEIICICFLLNIQKVRIICLHDL